MVDKKISELTEITTTSGSDILYIIDNSSGSPTSKKITINNFFMGKSINKALYKTYTLTSPEVGYPDATDFWNTSGSTWNTGQKLTNGLIGSLTYNDGNYVGWLNKDFYIRLDMETSQGGTLISVIGLHSDSVGIARPTGIKLEYSDNDSNWFTVEDRTGMESGTGGSQYWISSFNISGSGNHRYWKLSFTHDPDDPLNYTMISEIFFIA